jgi:hypothetical protein
MSPVRYVSTVPGLYLCAGPSPLSPTPFGVKRPVFSGLIFINSCKRMKTRHLSCIILDIKDLSHWIPVIRRVLPVFVPRNLLRIDYGLR